LIAAETAVCRTAAGAGQLCRNFEHSFGTLPRLLSFRDHRTKEGATVGAILLWLLGIPIPIIIILLLLWH
jgi:hypothetical protein